MHSKIRLYFFLSALYFSPRFVFLCINSRASDSLFYHWHLSDNLLHFGTLGFNGTKTTGFEPLYPFFLAFVRWITFDNHFLVLTFQILIGTIGCLYLYELGSLLSGNKRVGLIASIIHSFYPYLIYQTVMIIETTLFSTLLIIAAYYYCKATDTKNAIYCGIFFGLSILARTTALPILFLGTIALVIKKNYRQAIVILAIGVLMFLPMLIRNYQIDGSLFLTRSGENLFHGNCEYSDKLIPAHSVDLLHGYVYGQLIQERPDLLDNTKDRDLFLNEKAIQFMKQHPQRTITLKLKNIFYLFYPRLVPFHPMSSQTQLIIEPAGNYRFENLAERSLAKELTYSISYTFILLTALAGIYLRRKEFGKDLILYVIIFSFIVVYSLYFPTTRLRSSMDFILIFYSACAIESFLKRFKIPAWQIIKNPA